MNADYPSNSRSRNEPEEQAPKKVERVIEGEVLRRKKPWSRRIIESFGGGTKGVGGFVLLDVLLPAAKDALADATSQGIERMLFGEVRSTSRRPRGNRGGGSYVSYDRYSDDRNSRNRQSDRRQVSSRSRANHDFDEVILPTRVEADEVIERLFDLVSKYEAATVADLYELVGETSNYTDQKWGWTDIRGAGVTRIRNGYLLDLPRPEPLE
jgi:hypothetical protein